MAADPGQGEASQQPSRFPPGYLPVFLQHDMDPQDVKHLHTEVAQALEGLTKRQRERSEVKRHGLTYVDQHYLLTGAARYLYSHRCKIYDTTPRAFEIASKE